MGLINVPDRRIRKPIGMPQIDWDDPLNRGLVGYWGMFPYEFGGKIVHDLSGNGFDGTATGLAVPTPCKFGVGYDFRGATGAGKIEIDMKSQDPFGGKGLTIVAWVNQRQDNDSFPRIIDRDYDGQFAFYVHDLSNALSFSIETTGGTRDLEGNGTSPFTQNIWHQCVLTYDGTAAKLYQDGILYDNITDGTLGNPLSSVTHAMVIGERQDGSGRLWDGQIDHITMWNRALAASEITLLYRRPF